ncbi:MAG: endonuclease domain-containing protein [Xanthobacteraceae bacterium]|nr:endonuclease domain-containing protein [Xanthobacteraceae bacterium]
MSDKSRHRPINAATRGRARAMRKVSTDAERTMWLLLRDRRLAGFKFRRQVPFQGYILDFVCYDHRVIVEIDGGQHSTSVRDKARSTVLKREGFRVLRYWNNEVIKNPDGVLDNLVERLGLPT